MLPKCPLLPPSPPPTPFIPYFNNPSVLKWTLTLKGFCNVLALFNIFSFFFLSQISHIITD